MTKSKMAKAVARLTPEVYGWSTGATDYARASAEELGIAECFVGFLPKPHWILDDQEPAQWRGFQCVHPSSC